MSHNPLDSFLLNDTAGAYILCDTDSRILISTGFGGATYNFINGLPAQPIQLQYSGQIRE